MPDWVKSSRSGNNGVCVEVAFLPDHTAARDSKNADGPALVFGRTQWRGFIQQAKTGTFDRD